MQHLKGKLVVRGTKEYISDQNVRSTKSNLTSEEQRGVNSLRDNNDIVAYRTDKSGRFAVTVHVV